MSSLKWRPFRLGLNVWNTGVSLLTHDLDALVALPISVSETDTKCF